MFEAVNTGKPQHPQSIRGFGYSISEKFVGIAPGASKFLESLRVAVALSSRRILVSYIMK